MVSKDLRVHLALLFLVGVIASAPVFAGSAVIGSVSGSMNATLGGQAALPNTTIFSGDSLQVKDGAAVVTVGNSSRMVFGRETVASFLRDTNEVTVLLTRGSVSLYHPDEGTTLRVKANGVSIAPASGFKTVGEIAMVNGALVVTAKEGLLRLEGNGAPVDVAKGKSITLVPKAARAAAPQGKMSLGGASGAEVGALVGAGVAAVFSIAAFKEGKDAKDAANAADADAKAAGSAATAGSQAGADRVGCALNRFAQAQTPPKASPYVPFSPCT